MLRGVENGPGCIRAWHPINNDFGLPTNLSITTMPRERAVSEVKEPHSISLKVLR